MAAGVVLTARNVSTERRCAAALDSTHHLQLAEAHVAAVGVAPSGTVVAKNIRNLQSWTGHERRVLLRRLVLLALLGQLIERAHHLGDQVGGDAGVVRRRIEALVAEQSLDHPDIDTAIIEVRGKAVPKRVQVDGLRDAGGIGGFVEQPGELPGRQMQPLAATGKQPALGHGYAEVIFVRAQRPPFLQQRKRLGRQHDESVFLALALLDANDLLRCRCA